MKYNKWFSLFFVCNFPNFCLSIASPLSSNSKQNDYIDEPEDLVCLSLSGEKINNHQKYDLIEYNGLKFIIPGYKLKELLLTSKENLGAFIGPSNFEHNYPFFINGFVKNDTLSSKAWIILFRNNHNFNFSKIIDYAFMVFFKVFPFPDLAVRVDSSDEYSDIEKFCICLSLLKDDSTDCIVEKLENLDLESKIKLGLLMYSIEKFQNNEYDIVSKLFKEAFKKTKAEEIFLVGGNIPELIKKHPFLNILNLDQIAILLTEGLIREKEFILFINQRIDIIHSYI